MAESALDHPRPFKPPGNVTFVSTFCSENIDASSFTGYIEELQQRVRRLSASLQESSVNEWFAVVIDRGHAPSPNLGGGDDGIGMFGRCDRRAVDVM